MSLRTLPLLLLLWQPGAAAQGPADDADLAGGRERPFTVEVVAPGPGDLAYGDEISVSLRITPIRMTEFADIQFVPMGDLTALYAPAEEAPACEVDGGKFTIPAGSTLVAHCQLSALGEQRLWGPETRIRPGRQRIWIRIPVVDDGIAKQYFEDVVIVFRAPLQAIFLGGLTGSLLLSVFLAVRERVAEPLKPVAVSSWKSWVDIGNRVLAWTVNLVPMIWKMLLQTVMGGICALILILIAQGTEGVSPPITVKIQDFWGGVVIGLFSIPLSAWIWKQLRSPAS